MVGSFSRCLWIYRIVVLGCVGLVMGCWGTRHCVYEKFMQQRDLSKRVVEVLWKLHRANTETITQWVTEEIETRALCDELARQNEQISISLQAAQTKLNELKFIGIQKEEIVKQIPELVSKLTSRPDYLQAWQKEIQRLLDGLKNLNHSLETRQMEPEHMSEMNELEDVVNQIKLMPVQNKPNLKPPKPAGHNSLNNTTPDTFIDLPGPKTNSISNPEETQTFQASGLIMADESMDALIGDDVVGDDDDVAVVGDEDVIVVVSDDDAVVVGEAEVVVVDDSSSVDDDVVVVDDNSSAGDTVFVGEVEEEVVVVDDSSSVGDDVVVSDEDDEDEEEDDVDEGDRDRDGEWVVNGNDNQSRNQCMSGLYGEDEDRWNAVENDDDILESILSNEIKCLYEILLRKSNRSNKTEMECFRTNLYLSTSTMVANRFELVSYNPQKKYMVRLSKNWTRDSLRELHSVLSNFSLFKFHVTHIIILTPDVIYSLPILGKLLSLVDFYPTDNESPSLVISISPFQKTTGLITNPSLYEIEQLEQAIQGYFPTAEQLTYSITLYICYLTATIQQVIWPLLSRLPLIILGLYSPTLDKIDFLTNMNWQNNYSIRLVLPYSNAVLYLPPLTQKDKPVPTCKLLFISTKPFKETDPPGPPSSVVVADLTGYIPNNNSNPNPNIQPTALAVTFSFDVFISYLIFGYNYHHAVQCISLLCPLSQYVHKDALDIEARLLAAHPTLIPLFTLQITDTSAEPNEDGSVGLSLCQSNRNPSKSNSTDSITSLRQLINDLAEASETSPPPQFAIS
ncbi:hypothetical protein NEHOM01_0018 [Nematocida homosporus]|uniref:uncharacterized protein n=1 Tax=Nematocida homosporus TaxID=1912981 RepID=UPI00222080D5|nr:uncharacterized protein NEHOM01_0018 [Nematocida homosporus]KAI5184273.1 hypothetical protein NEHOM01_0018 [Nematocida homosporus]